MAGIRRRMRFLLTVHVLIVLEPGPDPTVAPEGVIRFKVSIFLGRPDPGHAPGD
jgi:hypothetical protein